MIKHRTITIGADPEFFFAKDGKIVGAEKVLPEDGMEYHDSLADREIEGVQTQQESGKVIIDGVQAELNPRPNSCRAGFAQEISACFEELAKVMKKQGVVANFSPTVAISVEELSLLSDKAKFFGCSPSFSTAEKSKMKIKDASQYPFRSAGGHLHLGNYRKDKDIEKVLRNPKLLVPILDIIVGNTCVILDRDEGNVERRKVYGRAGEYRTPPHGIEYRTLSNFWLRAYPLMSFVTGLARQAVQVCVDGHAKEFMDAVNYADVIRAINENDRDLAIHNFSKIHSILMKITPETDSFPIHKGNEEEIKYFLAMGADYWFKEDVLEHWIKLTDKSVGFESFLSTTVKQDLWVGFKPILSTTVK